MTTTKTKAQDILDKVIALRHHSRMTGMKTYRSENQLMNSLSAEELAEVAQGLMEHREQVGW
jgi:hypothetical protein